MNVLSRAATLALVLGSAPSPLPTCSQGQLLVSTGSGFSCTSLQSMLEQQRTSGWGAENVLPKCASGELLQSEGFGRWRCVEPQRLLPHCGSGESLRSDGSDWRCERAATIPSCSSGDVAVSQGGSSWSCTRFKP